MREAAGDLAHFLPVRLAPPLGRSRPVSARNPLPWRHGDKAKGERPWVVLDARDRIVLDCCDDSLDQTMGEACERAAAVVAAANGVLRV